MQTITDINAKIYKLQIRTTYTPLREMMTWEIIPKEKYYDNNNTRISILNVWKL